MTITVVDEIKTTDEPTGPPQNNLIQQNVLNEEEDLETALDRYFSSPQTLRERLFQQEMTNLFHSSAYDFPRSNTGTESSVSSAIVPYNKQVRRGNYFTVFNQANLSVIFSIFV